VDGKEEDKMIRRKRRREEERKTVRAGGSYLALEKGSTRRSGRPAGKRRGQKIE
jgi:hypothetical protein